MFETSFPGVFAIGDVRSGSVKRVASAVGEGSVVIQQVHRYLEAVRKPPREAERRPAQTLRRPYVKRKRRLRFAASGTRFHNA